MVWLTDHLDMTVVVYSDVKTQIKQNKSFRSSLTGVYTDCLHLLGWLQQIFVSKFFWFLQYAFHAFEPQHDKTNNVTCAPSKDSDQPGHPPSLIRVFAVRFMGGSGPKLSLGRQRRLIRLGRCPADLSLRWSHRSFCWFCHVAAHLERTDMC